jgi:translation initiation factor 1
MASKKISGPGGLVYSTDPNFKIEKEENPEEETLNPSAQKLKIKLDTKQRAGKAVTLVSGFTGSIADLETLGKKIKTYCGTGGSVKDGEIIVQGDNRDKVLKYLQQNEYGAKII